MIKRLFMLSQEVVIILLVLSLLLSVAVAKIVNWDSQRLEPYSINGSYIGNIPHSVDNFDVENNKLNVSGWAFLQGRDISVYSCHILFHDERNDKYLKARTMLAKRIDTTISVNDGFNYDNSGFTASIPIKYFERDIEYKLFILYQNDDNNILVSTDRTFTRE